MKPALVIHGGAWAIPDDEVAAHREAMAQALEVGRRMLGGGRPALEAVVAVIRTLEDHPALDAGVGAVLNQAGEVQLDAGIMDGPTRDFGAVAGVQRVEHPIEAAHRVLAVSGRQFSLLVGPRADAWAKAQGLATVEPTHFVVERERQRFAKLQDEARQYHSSRPFRGDRPKGTVGCVALDTEGRLAAGTSTGGAPYTVPGRVGDSPLPGCGYYASPEAGASSTGWGEAIARVLMCGHGVERVESGVAPQQAAEQEIARLAGLVRDPEGCGATGGLILLDRQGRVGIAWNTPRMARGWWTAGTDLAFDC